MENKKPGEPGQPLAPLPPNHRRAVTSTLLLLDELVVRYQYAAAGGAVSSVLIRESNDLTPAQRDALNRLALEIKGHLEEMAKDLRLKTKDKDIAAALRWQSAAVGDALQELRGRRLRAYGPVSEAAARYLDGKLEIILRLLREASSL